MKNKIMPSIVLGSICLVVALLLSVVNMFTAPIIEAAEQAKVQAALEVVLPDCGKVEAVLDGYADGTFAEEVNEIYSAENGGYVFQMTVKGYATGMVVLVGIGSDGKISGTKCTTDGETPSKKAPVFAIVDGDGSKYIGMGAGDYKPVLEVSGSTMTSQGYANAVKIALDAYAKIKGGN